MINILEMSLYDRSLEYVNKLIIYPLEKYNHHKFDDEFSTFSKV